MSPHLRGLPLRLLVLACLPGLLPACTCSPAAAVGASCSADSDCVGGSVCDGVCKAPCPNGAGCGVSQECRSGLCTALTAPCGDRPCTPEEACVDLQCWPRSCDGIACPEGEVCKGGVCVDVRCVGVLCPLGQFCFQGLCLADSCRAADGGQGGGAGGGAAGGTGGGGPGGGTGGGSPVDAGPVGIISGAVLSYDFCEVGPPLSTAAITVTARCGAAGTFTTTTDGNGRFQFQFTTDAQCVLDVDPGSSSWVHTSATAKVAVNEVTQVSMRLLSACSVSTTLPDDAGVQLLAACSAVGQFAGATLLLPDLLGPDGGAPSNEVQLIVTPLVPQAVGDGGVDLSLFAAAPGSMRAVGATDAGVVLESRGGAWFGVRDYQTYQWLQLRAGASFPAELVAADAPTVGDLAEMYHYDEAAGLWQRSGTGTAAVELATPVWTFTATAQGWWMAARASSPPTCIRGTVQSLGAPAPGAEVRVVGYDFPFSVAAPADATGQFCTDVKASANLVLLGRTGTGPEGVFFDAAAVKPVTSGAVSATCAVNPQGCLDVGPLVLVAPQSQCLSGALTEDLGAGPVGVTQPVFIVAPVSLENEYRRLACYANARVSGFVPGPAGRFCAAVPAGLATVMVEGERSGYSSGCDTLPVTTNGTASTCGGGGCTDAGTLDFVCHTGG